MTIRWCYEHIVLANTSKPGEHCCIFEKYSALFNIIMKLPGLYSQAIFNLLACLLYDIDHYPVARCTSAIPPIKLQLIFWM